MIAAGARIRDRHWRLFLCALLSCKLVLAQSPETPIAAEGCPAEVDGVLCYLSTDCRGGLAVDGADGAVAATSAAECCGGLGLSFCDSRGCENCFREEAYSRSGTKFHLGFFNNLRFGVSLLSQANLRVQVTSDATEPATIRLTYRDREEMETVLPGETVSINVDRRLRLNGIGERDKAVLVESIGGQEISVAGLSEEVTSADSFCVLPQVFLPTDYEYYAVSVPQAQLASESDGVIEILDPVEKSAFLIVSTEDKTRISLTLTQTVETEGADDLKQFGPAINRGETVTLTLDRDQTLYVSSIRDLTGSRVVSNKPITFFSGHECGTIPQTFQYCDQMIEQIPPTATWGKEFFTAPFLTRSGGDAFIVVAAQDDTRFFGVCLNDAEGTVREMEIVISRAGQAADFNVTSDDFCRFESSKPVLLTQLSFASRFDGNINADPFMALIPPVQQYRDILNFQVFSTLTAQNESHFINVFLPSQFDRSELRLNGFPLPEALWIPIPCDDSLEDVCAYAAQVEVMLDTQTVVHTDPEARFSVIVYSLGFRTGQGYSVGMMQRPIALDEVTLEQGEYSVREEDEVLSVQLFRSGDLSRTTSVLLRSRTLNTPNAAQVGIDYSEFSELITFEPQQSTVQINVILSEDDVFPEPDKVFELFLSHSEGVFITPFAAATVTIVNQDPDLPVMEVSFDETFRRVREGQGVLEVNLVKSEGAVGPVRVRLFTEDFTARGGADYVPIEDMVITFLTEETQKTQQILILDDLPLEDDEIFFVNIEAINEEGDLPVVTVDNTAEIEIEDTDVVVIGYNPVPCRTNEGVEGLNVQVDLLFGVLARNVSVTLQTLENEGSASAGEDFIAVSRTLVFSSSRRGNGFSVFISIRDDDILEETESFTVRLSLEGEGEGEGEGGVQLIHPVAEVFIADDDSVVIGLELTPQVSEGGVATATVAVLEGRLQNEVRVRLSAIGGNATAGVDFEGLDNVEVILDQQNPRQSLSIQTFDNDNFEGNKVFSVVIRLISIGQRVGVNPSVAMTTIIEDEAVPEVLVQCYFLEDCSQNSLQLSSMSDCCVLLQGQSFSFPGDPTNLCHECIVVGFDRSEFILLERAESYELRVEVQTGTLPQDISLGVVTVPGSASPEDYVVSPAISLFALPFSDLRPSANVSVQLPREQDNTDERFETFRIDLEDTFGTAPSNMFFRGTAVTIIDFQPVVQFEVTEYTVSEGGGGIIFAVVVTVTPAPDEPIEVIANIIGDTPEVNGDIQALRPSYTIPSGATSTRLLFRIVDDETLERDEQFFIELASVSSGIIGALNRARVVIVDDDRVILDFRTFNGVEGREGFVAVTRLGNASFPISVTVTVSGDTATSDDFAPPSQTVTIQPDQSEVNASIRLLEDNIVEARESVRVSVFSNTNAEGVLSPDFGGVRLFIDDNDVAVVEFAETAYAVSENAGSVSVGVALSPDTLIDARLELGVQLLALQFGDLRELVEVFLSNSTPLGVAVFSIRNDNVTDGNSQFTVAAREAETDDIFGMPQLVQLPDFEVTVTIIEDDSLAVGFTLTSYTVEESARLGTRGVDPSRFLSVGVAILDGVLGRSEMAEQGVTVTVMTIGQTAEGDRDYVESSVDVFLGRENEEETVTIEIIPDNLLEEDEVFLLSLQIRDAAVPVIPQPDSASVTIFDDDGVQIGFDREIYFVSEGTDAAMLIVRVIEGQLGRDVFVEFFTGGDSNDTALVGEDYVGTTVTLTFSASDREQTVLVPIMDDDEFEQDLEAFTAQLVLASRINVVLSPDFAVVLIRDNDLPELDLSCVSSAVPGRETFECESTNPPVSVICSFDEGLAENCSFPLVLGIEMFGTDNHTVAITVVDEFGQSVTVIFPFSIAEPLQPPISVGLFSLSDTIVSESDEEGVVLFVRVLSGFIDSDGVIVEFSFISGTADVDTDIFKPEVSILTLRPKSDRSRDDLVFIRINNDDIYEADESFSVRIVSTSRGTVDPDQQEVTITILDDDRLFVSGRGMTVNESAEVSVITLVKERNSAAVPITVTLEVPDINPDDPGFGARGGEDYIPFRVIVTFAPNETVREVLVTIVNDNRVEEMFEEVAFFITSELPRVNTSGEPNFFGIVDDDSAVIGFSPSVYTVPEDSGVVEVTVRVLSGRLGLNLRLQVFTTDTEENSATVGSDYIPLGNDVVLNEETTEASVNITIIDDEIPEGREFFTVSLFATLEADVNVVYSPPRATVVIEDDEPSQFQVGFRSTSESVRESGEVVLLFVDVLNGPTDFDAVIVEISFINGSANVDTDIFRPEVSTLTLEPGSTNNVLFVGINNDDIYEADESFSVRIVSTSRGIIVDPDLEEVNITILDDDRLFVSGRGMTVNESAEVSVITLVKERNSAAVPITVTLEVPDINPDDPGFGARGGEDYIPFRVIVTFAPNETVREVLVTIVNDNRVEELFEEVAFFITSELPRVNTSGEPNFFGIVDDDSAVIGFSPSVYTVPEDSGVVEVTVRVLSGRLGLNVRLQVFTTDTEENSATVGSDYIPLSDDVVLNEVTTEASVNITIVDDEIPEGEEFFTVSLFATIEADVNIVYSPPRATVVIEDDESSQFQVGFQSTSESVRESGEVVLLFVDVLNGPTDFDAVIVEISFINGSANVDTDIFRPEVSTLTLEPGSTNNVLFVGINNDDIYEADESFSVRIVSTSRGTVDPERQEAIVTILDDDRVTVRVLEEQDVAESEAERNVLSLVKFGASEIPVRVLVMSSEEFSFEDPDQAIPEVDFELVEMIVEFAPGEDIKEIPFVVIDDNITEAFEVVSFDITSRMPRVNDGKPLFNVVFIRDDDSARIGFNPINYRVLEIDGFVELVVGVLEGSLGTSYRVQFDTEEIIDFPSAAQAFRDFNSTSVELEFNGDVASHTVRVTIFSDEDLEEDEQFIARLSIVETLEQEISVQLSPGTATVTISDMFPTDSDTFSDFPTERVPMN